MADGPSYWADIYVDLTIAGARILRDVLRHDGKVTKITGIRIRGTAGAGAGHIVLRRDAAAGPEVFKQLAPAGVEFDEDFDYAEHAGSHPGLYMDDIVSPWAAGSYMMIRTQ